MEVTEQIKLAKEFIEKEYPNEISLNKDDDKHFLEIDFFSLAKVFPDLANEILDQPEELIKAFEIAMNSLGCEGWKVRFYNLSNDSNVPISMQRTKHLSKFVKFQAMIKGVTPVSGKVTIAKFECPACGNILKVFQTDTLFKEPNKCGCGRTGKFNCLEKDLIDACTVLVDELPELSENPNPIDMQVVLTRDLVRPAIYNRLFAGIRIEVTGIPTQYHKIIQGKKSNEIVWYIDANNVKIYDDNYTGIIITSEDIAAIKEFASKGDVVGRLADQIFSAIVGCEMEKQILTLMSVGGNKVTEERNFERGDIHILLIGDSGLAKTKMIKQLLKVSLKGRYVSGGSSSKVGLGAGVQRDEILGRSYLVAGALPLSHKGICAIDELDGLSDEDTKMLNEAMENQEVTVNKIVKGTFKTECAVLMGANPKGGAFDHRGYAPLLQQINIKPALISRCDCILLFEDQADEERDLLIAKRMLYGRKEESMVSTEFIRKYTSYAKKLTPVLTSEAMDFISGSFAQIRKTYYNSEYKNVPMTYREVNSIRRMAEAIAKIKLKSFADIDDAKQALVYKMYSLKQVSIDPATGILDSNIITGNMSVGQRNVANVIMDYLRENVFIGNGGVEVTLLMSEVRKKMPNITDDQIEDAMKKLQNSGDVFFPRYGFVKRLE